MFATELLTSLSLSLFSAGVAVRAAALEGGSLSREPDAVGEPVHDPAFPEPLPGRARPHLRAGEQRRAAAPQRAAVSPDAHLQRAATGERHGARPAPGVALSPKGPRRKSERLCVFE